MPDWLAMWWGISGVLSIVFLGFLGLWWNDSETASKSLKRITPLGWLLVGLVVILFSIGIISALILGSVGYLFCQYLPSKMKPYLYKGEG